MHRYEIRSEVQQTMHRWTWGYDFDDPELMASCFTDDATLTVEIGNAKPVVYNGRAELLALFTSTFTSQDDQRYHAMTNVVFDAESPEEVLVRSYLLMSVVVDAIHVVKSTGHYHDRLVPVSDDWKFASRRIHLDMPY